MRDNDPKNPVVSVLGLAFTQNMSRIFLLPKPSGDPNRGELTGVWGNVKPHETSLDTMRRAFQDASGWSYPASWSQFATTKHKQIFRHIFTTILDIPWEPLKRGPCGQLRSYNTANILLDRDDPPAVDDLRYLVPMARIHLLTPFDHPYFHVTETPRCS